MKTLSALIAFLCVLVSPAFATEGSSAQELCTQAKAQHAGKDVSGADLSIAMAKDVADNAGGGLPNWCQKHYRELRLNGLTYSLQKFDTGYGDD